MHPLGAEEATPVGGFPPGGSQSEDPVVRVTRLGAEIPLQLLELGLRPAAGPSRELDAGFIYAKRMKPRNDAGEGLARAGGTGHASPPAACVSVDLDPRIGEHGARNLAVDGLPLLGSQDQVRQRRPYRRPGPPPDAAEGARHPRPAGHREPGGSQLDGGKAPEALQELGEECRPQGHQGLPQPAWRGHSEHTGPCSRPGTDVNTTY